MSSLNSPLSGIGPLGTAPRELTARPVPLPSDKASAPTVPVVASAVQPLGQSAELDKSADAASRQQQQLQDAVDKVSKAVSGYSRELQFSIDQDLHTPVVKVIDSQTQQLIRQIPSEEMLNIAKDLDKVLGVLLEQKA